VICCFVYLFSSCLKVEHALVLARKERRKDRVEVSYDSLTRAAAIAEVRPRLQFLHQFVPFVAFFFFGFWLMICLMGLFGCNSGCRRRRSGRVAWWDGTTRTRTSQCSRRTSVRLSSLHSLLLLCGGSRAFMHSCIHSFDG
jgi:hypothetical protein